jgi:hypothetical protein
MTQRDKQEELGSQAAAVWRFIMDRQLEAPDEFAALQTHRVQLAVARRQLAFVERMAQVRLLLSFRSVGYAVCVTVCPSGSRPHAKCDSLLTAVRNNLLNCAVVYVCRLVLLMT